MYEKRKTNIPFLILRLMVQKYDTQGYAIQILCW